MDFDIVVVGAGPAGCTFVSGLHGSGLRIAVVEPQDENKLRSPSFDGREIALSQRTVDVLLGYGIWPHIPHDEVSVISAARVIDGKGKGSLDFRAPKRSAGPIGRLVPNHVIRKAAFTRALENPNVVLVDGHSAAEVSPGRRCSTVKLSDGSRLTTKLVVAADTRFSTIRRQVGIAASMHDFGQTMIVCRMSHGIGHQDTAWECFLYGLTLAVLPLNGGMSSIILTLPQHLATQWLDKPADDYAADIENALSGRFGKMELASERIAYPLVGVYAEQFVSDGFALVGDAAVGMHPVTAHGYNFCVTGVHALSQRVARAARNGSDIRSRALLRSYEMEHRLRTRPLFEATKRLVQLYTTEAPHFRLARKAILRTGNAMAPAKAAIAGLLMRHAV
ncbi:5-demethoxyubiquinol-8 5-hydroxylase UbiM [Hyphobacterium sp.]|uniref:5-demethoxyubiquinol-8 5-hydroxylase UbiM n=1 Tax=Hyphobacterium sp. TaxID=2004662 RepID=UPI003B525EC5